MNKHTFTAELASLNSLKIEFSHCSDFYCAKMQPDSSHIHDCCEVYVNVCGHVNFMVENHVYDIHPGDVVITRPNEYHHCIYISDTIHDHYCIFIYPNGNEKLLSFFYDRPLGEKNLISSKEELKNETLRLCSSIESAFTSETAELVRYSLMFRLFAILDEYEKTGLPSAIVALPEKLMEALDYINSNFASITSVKILADQLFISINTLDRLFRNNLGVTPRVYIENKRFANAKMLLGNGKNVSDACFDSGFRDYSHFISGFRKRFSITPYQYRIQQTTEILSSK